LEPTNLYALSIILVYMVLAALYESWTSPAAVILVVPVFYVLVERLSERLRKSKPATPKKDPIVDKDIG